MPKVHKQHIEYTEYIGDTCTQCYQRVHIGRTVFRLLPRIDEKSLPNHKTTGVENAHIISLP
jgi:hypothetical protein